MNVLKEKIREADFVLVGIGEECSADLAKMEEVPEYKALTDRVKQRSGSHWMLPYIERLFLKEHPDVKIEAAYEELGKLLKDKHYFIISTCMDDYIYKAPLEGEWIVTPCGGYRFMQCEDGCEGRLWEVQETVSAEIQRCAHANAAPESVIAPACSVCGKPLVFNNLKNENYLEAGYMEQWNRYTKWLQGTVNRKLCVVELGAGMQLPSVIRWPFEKAVYYNRKACLFRVHSRLYQLTEELKERGYSICENPLDFLINRFV